MFRIEWIQEGKTSFVKEGTRIIDAMRTAGLHPDAPCGGVGKCGKCTVTIMDTGEQVLACQTVIDRDLRIMTKADDTGNQILTDGTENHEIYQPAFRKLWIDVEPCPLGQSISDWTRFRKALTAAVEGPVNEMPDPYIAGRLPGQLKKNGGRVQVVFFEGRALEVSAEEISVLMAAFDIGTTTVAGYLLHGDDGRKIAVSSRMNPQAQYGADVISRAGYSLEHGMKEISSVIRKALREMVEEMTAEAGYTAKDVFFVSVAGNTCMHHLYLGIDVDSLVHAPYNPAVQEAMILEANDYGLRIHDRGCLLAIPNIAGFVGADTVACLVASDLAEQDRWTLLIDIGTNGEMVLGKNHHMAACSTAAGPAFEGAGISCGMRGAEGAISKVHWNGEEFELSIIGDKPGIGICGSGLLDLAAELLRSGQMDEYGEMDDPELVLIPAERSGRGKAVSFLQKDVRELQMAKAAIRAGIELLASYMEIEVTDIEQVWLAGAFGSFLNSDSACAIGMIPPELKDRISAIGNAAGQGAQLVLQNSSRWNLASSLAAEAEFIELAVMPEFQDTFVESLEFPESEE